MGIIHKGISKTIALRLAERNGLSVFVETGTLKGETAYWASGHFERVVTIELDDDIYRAAKERFKLNKKIEVKLGNSATVLSEIIPTLSAPALFWLDAHWSRDLGYDRPDFGECPLLDEIGAILESRFENVVMIDDARYFLSPPPKPHRATDWPSVRNILQKVAGRLRWHILEEDILILRLSGAKGA